MEKNTTKSDFTESKKPTLEDWEKMFVRQWAAGHVIMGRLVEHDWYDEKEGSHE